MHFKPARLEARVALDEGHMNELVARQRGVTTDDDPFGWLTSLFGDGETTTTTARTTTTRGATTIVPLLPTTSLTTSRTTSTTPRTTSTSSTISTAQVVTTPPPLATSSRQTTTITSTASGDSDTSQANADAGSNPSSGGLPSVVIGIIVAASVIFGLIFIALIARKIFQARRRNRRNTWAHNSIIAPYAPPVTEKALPPPPPVENTSYPSYPAYPPAAAAAPMVSYANNPIMNQPYSPAAPSSAGYPAPYPFGGNSALGPQNTYQGATTTAGAFNAADLAGPVVIQHTPPTPTVAASAVPVSIVKRTFVPSLPDELSISNGDKVRVLSAYDDGWALCENMSTGEKGVVPQECLETAKPTGGDESRLNRNSSLRRQQDQTN